MKKFIILILIIFAVSYAQNIYEYEVKEHYYQILLKEWQTNKGDCQELNRTNTMLKVDVYDINEMIRKELAKHYKEKFDIDMWRTVDYTFMGEQYEYVLAVARYKSDYDQVWFLISRKLKKIISIYKDKRPLEKPVNLWTPEERQRREADVFYRRLLGYWDPGIPFKACPPLPWDWWVLNTWDSITIVKENVDSVTAVSIAVKAAVKCHGNGMTPIAVRLMGRYKEHWMVYIYDRKRQQCFDPIQAYNAGVLSWMIASKISSGKAIRIGGFLVFTKREECPLPIGVLVSRRDGQVLFMGEL
jgi:hypothetical protein